MLAFIALFFPAVIMVIWKRRLFHEKYDWKEMLAEYIAGVVLINFLVIAVAYVFFGSRGSVVGNINTYINYALEYILLAMVLAIAVPWGWKWIWDRKSVILSAWKNVGEDEGNGTVVDPAAEEEMILPQEENGRFAKIKNHRCIAGACALYKKVRSFLGRYISRKFAVYFLVAVAVFFAVFAVCYEDFTEVSSETIDADGILGRMTRGNVYCQNFVCEYDGLESIALYFATYDETADGTLSICLLSDETVIQEWDVECVRLADNSYYTLLLDTVQEESAGVEYTIEIIPDTDEETAATAYINTSGDYSGLSVNGKTRKGQSICYLLNYTNAFPDNGAGRYIARYLILAAVIFAAWIFIQTRKMEIENTFLVFWILISGLFICSNTLFNVPDEYGHFYRAYEVSTGELISLFDEETNSGGSYLPLPDVGDEEEEEDGLYVLKESWQEYEENKGLLVLTEEDEFIEFNNIAVYSPVNYLPQAVGIFIARSFTNNIAAIVYAGRFTNWIVATILLYLAIRILPKGKEFLCIVALLPMNIHEAVSLASDTVIVAISALMIAYVMFIRYSQTNVLKKHQILILYVLAALISQYKIVYIVFCLVYVLIPADKFKRGVKEKWIHASVMILLVLGLNLGWLSTTGRFMVRGGTDSDLQIAYMMRYPIRYLLTVARTLLSDGIGLIQQMMGTSLAWLNVSTFGIVTMLCAVQLIYITGRDRRVLLHDKRQTHDRLCYFAIIVLVTLLITVSEYVYWTYTYSTSVSGMQGRYFAPLLLPAYLIAVGETHPHEKSKKEFLSLFSQFVLVISNVGACMSLLFACID